MLDSKLRDVFLVDEMQLKERLNTSLQSNNAADFHLMLSMLSQDVTDAPWIKENKLQDKKEDLRETFQLSKPQKDYGDPDDFDRGIALGERLATEGMTSVFLCQCLRAEPLVPIRHIYDPDVLSLLDPLKKEKLLLEENGEDLQVETFQEKGDGFLVLDEIKSSRTL